MPRLLFLMIAGCVAGSVHAASVYIEDLTWPEVRDAIAAGKSTAIIYAGSTEQKGPHMAIGEHNVVAHYVGGRVADTLGNALVFPIFPYALTGDPVAKTGHMAFPGSVSLSSDVFSAVVRQIAISAIAGGFKEIYLMGDHGGGQQELKAVAESLDAEWSSKGAVVRYVPDLYFKSRDLVRKQLTERNIVWGAHADAWDTSELMFLDTEHKWIRTDKLVLSNPAEKATSGVDGDPSKATAELGKLFLDIKVDAAVSQIRTFRAGKRGE